MDKQPVGTLPDLTASSLDDEIMIITDSERSTLQKEKVSDFITDLTSTDENNAIVKGMDGKLFTKDFGNASNITEGTLPVSVLPNIPKDKLPEIETDDLPDSGITAGTYTYPTDIVVNSKGQVTSITEGQAGANNANQDLSNLGPLGLDKINQSKALETGSVSSDADVYADIQKYAHSTFDKSKFEVVGSPTISDDGIASGFSGSNYITTSEFKLGNGAWRCSGSFITGNDVSGLQIISSLKGSGITFYNACGTYINNNKLYLSIDINGSVQTASVDVSPLTYYNFALNFKNPNYVFEVNNEVIKTYNSSELVSFNQSNLVISIGQYGYSGSAYSGFTGSIDLKSFSIWADGIPVFNGNITGTDTINNIEIPYTLSKTGSKIVDVAYRDKVQQVYEQTGEALFYTLDEQNQNFTLPMGEIYGMIEKKDETLNNPYTLFDSKYSEAPLYNASWLLSNGTYYAKSVYVTAYEALVVENNSEIEAGTSVSLPSGGNYVKRGLSVKLSTAEDITDFDFVVNTTDETFRLPIKTTKANQEISGLYLYFYVGETVQNANLIDAGRIAELFTTKQFATSASFPSDRYTNLSLGASNSNYTAPADGYFVFDKSSTSSNQFIDLFNTTSGVRSSNMSAGGSNPMSIFVPAKKNDTVNVQYNAGGSVIDFKFVYAEGAKND